MRLIDADHLLFLLNSAIELRKKLHRNTSDLDMMVYAVNDEPTAYDLDKVVEQLRDEEELSYADFEIYAEEHSLSEDDDWHHRGLGRAIEIVKRGGTDGKID